MRHESWSTGGGSRVQPRTFSRASARGVFDGRGVGACVEARPSEVSAAHLAARAHIPREHGRALASRRHRGVARRRCDGEHHRPRVDLRSPNEYPTLAGDDKARGLGGARRSPRRHPDIPRRRRRRHPRARQEDLRESFRVGARRGGGRRAVVRIVGDQSAPLGGTPAPPSRPPPPDPQPLTPSPLTPRRSPAPSTPGICALSWAPAARARPPSSTSSASARPRARFSAR